MKKIKILITLFILSLLSFGINLYFQTYTVNNIAKKISDGSATFQRLNIINTSTTSVYVKFYEKSSIPTFTNTPKYVYALNPSTDNNVSEIQPIILNSTGTKNVLTFTNTCWVRCTKGFSPNDNTTPDDSVYIDLDF